MDASTFDCLLNQVADPCSGQCTRLLAALTARVDHPAAADIIQAAMANKLRCPRCQGAQWYRHGQANGLQRFRCRGCGRTFHSLTGTPLARLRHKDQWLDYGACILDTRTVRQAAARLAIDKSTSMRWRHRFLGAIKADRPATLHGIAEADETFLLESKKGAREWGRPARKRGGHASKRGIAQEQVCILVARDRSGNTDDFVTGRGPVTRAQLPEHLPRILAPDTLLVTDANAAYRAFANQAGIAHAYVNPRAGVRVAAHARGAIHGHNVHGYHSRFHGWLRQFRGVAARYLSHYLGWRWAIDQHRIHSPETLLRAAIGVFHSECVQRQKTRTRRVRRTGTCASVTASAASPAPSPTAGTGAPGRR